MDGNFEFLVFFFMGEEILFLIRKLFWVGAF